MTRQPPILSTVACNLDSNILAACLPLFEAERVQALEWSFDTLFSFREIPGWFTELLHEFSRENRLIGHGVFFSMFSGRWSAGQQNWLQNLEKLAAEFRFDHITEHFGFMTGLNFHDGAPISIPFTPATLAIGIDRLQRIQAACRCPVGLENLAFSYSLEEVKKHGEFLDKLIEPINGFIILDLHNLFCQLHNLNIEFNELIALYPLERVREIHISGGSWEDSVIRPDQKIRRDTHDSAVPEAVFKLLEQAIPRCPNLKFVVLEQLGHALDSPENQRQFQLDFLRMDEMVAAANLTDSAAAKNNFLPTTWPKLGEPLENEPLHFQQRELSEILETAADFGEANKRLAASSLAHSAWEIENWEPAMLETVREIAQKWKGKTA